MTMEQTPPPGPGFTLHPEADPAALEALRKYAELSQNPDVIKYLQERETSDQLRQAVARVAAEEQFSHLEVPVMVEFVEEVVRILREE